jgi:hypothetical protein
MAWHSDLGPIGPTVPAPRGRGRPWAGHHQRCFAHGLVAHKDHLATLGPGGLMLYMWLQKTWKKHVKTCYSTLSTPYIHVESHMLSRYKEMMYIQLMKDWAIGGATLGIWIHAFLRFTLWIWEPTSPERSANTATRFFGAQLVMGEMVAWNSW